MKRYGMDTPSGRKKAGAGKRSGLRSPLSSNAPCLKTEVVGPLQSPRVRVETDMQTGPAEAVDSQQSLLRKALNSMQTPTAAKEVIFSEAPMRPASCSPFSQAHAVPRVEAQAAISISPQCFLLSVPETRSRLRQMRPIKSPSDLLSYDDFVMVINSPERSVRNSFVSEEGTRSFRKDEAARMKQLAKLKEVKRQQRLQAAVRIQAWIRGVLTRRRVAGLFARRRAVLRQARLQQLRSAVKVSWAPYRICRALQAWTKRQKEKRAQVLLLFQQHCAVSIQKAYRGYRERRRYRPAIAKKMHQRALLAGLLLGWKTRRILKFRKIESLILQLREMEGLSAEGSAPSDLAYNISMQIPMLRRRLLGEFSRLFATGKWVERQPLSAKKSSPKVERKVAPVSPTCAGATLA